MKQKFFSKHREPFTEAPDLIQIQRASYDWLIKEGLPELFKEISPIHDYSEKKFELSFLNLRFDEPALNEHEAKTNQVSYETPLRITVRLKNKTLGTDHEQEIFL